MSTSIEFDEFILSVTRVEYLDEPLNVCREIEEKYSKTLEEGHPMTYENRLETSNLRESFCLDLWDCTDGLLLLCGIDPEALVISYEDMNDQDAVVNEITISHAVFFGEPNGYKLIDEEDYQYWYDSLRKDLSSLEKTLDELLSIDISRIKLHEKHEGFIGIVEARIEAVSKIISNEQDDIFSINSMHKSENEKRSCHAKQLGQLRRLWKSGEHANRNTPSYFIKWALNKGHEISWLDWAQEQGFFTDIAIPDNDGSSITSEYLKDLQRRVNHLERKYPNWESATKVVQNTGNLIEWIKTESNSNTREAEIIKTALFEVIPELKKR